MDYNKEELEATRRKFVAQQKKMIIKFIFFLIFVIFVILVYQLFNYNKANKQNEVKSIEQNAKEISHEIEEMSVSSEVSNCSTNEIQIQILNGLKKQLPQTIDQLTVLRDAEFKDNILIFKIEIDDRKISQEDLDKFNSSKLNTLLLKNKPIACSLMTNIANWDELWKINYSYFLLQSGMEVGHVTFSKGECR